MPRFAKKPVVIEAVQFNPENESELVDLADWLIRNGAAFRFGVEAAKVVDLEIRTLEDGGDGRAKHVASAGDWIIKGIQGEFYPCKPDIFDASYEVAA